MKLHHLIVPPALALASCTLGPDFKWPDISAGSSWKETRSTTSAQLPDTWWRLFNDLDLTRLIERALASNNDLAAAKARVDTARALVGVDRARMFPTLDLNGSAGIARASESATTRNMPVGLPIDLDAQRYRSTFDLAYDPDLWGRNKRSLESTSAQAAAAQAMLDSQRLGVATEVARQYFLLRGLDTQKAVLARTIASRQSTLNIQTSKAEAGLSDGLSSSQARTELELSRHDLASVERQRGAAEHALAVLCASRPADFAISMRDASGKLPSIRPGLPAAVLSRRPDIRAAAENLRSANARIGVAEAAFYPNFSLSAGAGFESIDVRSFLDWENRVLSLGAGIAAPVFNGGSNKANHQAAVSRRDEALANYRIALLTALREVEDALVDLMGLARSRSALDRALASAKDTQRLSKDRYDKGMSGYLEVVESDRTALRIELVLAQIDAQQRITLAALAKALGGGWNGK